jgi:tetratricopeptide (TPR) repeat protein
MPGWSSPYVNKIETFLLNDGNISEARSVMDAAIKNTGERLQDVKIRLDILDGKLKEALYETDHSVPGNFEIKGEKYLFYAKIYSLLNNPKIARIYYDSALVSLNENSMVKKDAIIHSLIAIAYAGNGNKEKALEESKLSVDLAIRNKMDESDMKLTQAEVYIMIGDYDNAIINIEYLLNNPSVFSVRLLRLDPVWKPLLKLPEVTTLLKKYSEK